MSELRQKSLACLNSRVIINDIVDLFVQTWELFSKLNEAHSYYLPPLYLDQDNNGDKIILAAIEGLLIREKGRRQAPPGPIIETRS